MPELVAAEVCCRRPKLEITQSRGCWEKSITTTLPLAGEKNPSKLLLRSPSLLCFKPSQGEDELLLRWSRIGAILSESVIAAPWSPHLSKSLETINHRCRRGRQSSLLPTSLSMLWSALRLVHCYEAVERRDHCWRLATARAKKLLKFEVLPCQGERLLLRPAAMLLAAVSREYIEPSRCLVAPCC